MFTVSRTSTWRGFASLLAGLALLAPGCQSYQPIPLDPAASRAAFIERMPASPQVTEFAARLYARQPASEPFDHTDGVSCAEAELIALVFNAEVRLARLRAGVSLASVEHAGLWDDPTLALDVTRVIQSVPEPWKLASSIGITFPISGRLASQTRQAQAQHALELARVAQREWGVRSDVRRRWTHCSALEMHLAVARESLASIEQVLALVDRMEAAGEIPRTQARLFRIERAAASMRVTSLEARLEQAHLALRQVMGLAPDAPLHFQGTGIGPALPASDDEVADFSAPSLLVARASYELAERDVQTEIRRQYPDLHLSPGYGREDGDDQALLGISVPLPLLNANRAGIAQALARRELARGEFDVALEQHMSDLARARAMVRAAVSVRESLERDIAPQVDAQALDSRELVRLGEVNTLVLLESVTRQHDTRASLIDARRDEVLARIDLLELQGPSASAPASQASDPIP